MVIALFCLLLSCVKEKTQVEMPCGVIESFNTEASRTFANRYLYAHYLDSMNAIDKCVLEKTISNYLNMVNNWETIVIDSFYIRSYNFSDFIDRFSFVTKDNGDFYFVYIPDFNDIFTGNNKFYSQNKSGRLELRESPDSYVIKFDITLLTNFLDREVTHSKDFTQQATQVERLLPALLPHILSSRCHLFELMDSLANRPVKQRNEILKSLEPAVPPKDLTSGMSSTHRLVYRNVFGFVIIHLKQRDDRENLDLDFYFIPDRFTGRYIRHGDPLFQECYY